MCNCKLLQICKDVKAEKGGICGKFDLQKAWGESTRLKSFNVCEWINMKRESTVKSHKLEEGTNMSKTVCTVPVSISIHSSPGNKGEIQNKGL